ncbi:uncharacterized protein LOC142352927 [Convolutriloba macropyga]|uniref:uncharacterized protein LOC142352927 n=1 Tax=Convolutriloba macropyga TaxID=536237 RepID=UPI003F525AC8
MFTQLLPKHPKAAFIDIGAHMGLYTISAAKTGHRVFAFEPNEDTWKYLQGSVEVNNLQSNVSIFPYALMDRRDKCIVLTTPFAANIGHSVVQECRHNSKAIKTALLDDLLPHLKLNNLSEAVIKIDVEAAEPLVFLGGKQFLRKIYVPYIMMEAHQMQEKYLTGNKTLKSLIVGLLKELSSLGYYALPVGVFNSSALNISLFEKWPGDIVWHLN